MYTSFAPKCGRVVASLPAEIFRDGGRLADSRDVTFDTYSLPQLPDDDVTAQKATRVGRMREEERREQKGNAEVEDGLGEEAAGEA